MKDIANQLFATLVVVGVFHILVHFHISEVEQQNREIIELLEEKD